VIPRWHRTDTGQRNDGGVNQGDGDLGILDAAHRAGVLALHTSIAGESHDVAEHEGEARIVT
jgi:hypothetical protein